MNQPSNPLLNQQPQYHQPQQFNQQQAPVMTIGDWIVTSIVLAIPLVNLRSCGASAVIPTPTKPTTARPG